MNERAEKAVFTHKLSFLSSNFRTGRKTPVASISGLGRRVIDTRADCPRRAPNTSIMVWFHVQLTKCCDNLAGSCRTIAARTYFIFLHMSPHLQYKIKQKTFILLKHLFCYIAHETTPLGINYSSCTDCVDGCVSVAPPTTVVIARPRTTEMTVNAAASNLSFLSSSTSVVGQCPRFVICCYSK